MNRKEVETMIHRARGKNCFLMDALWTLCLPHILKVKEIVDSGQLGRLVSVRADFGFTAEFNPESRLFNRDLGGGALLDIGIYPLMLSLFLMGKPSKIVADAYIGATHIDEDCGFLLQFGEKQTAHLHASLVARTPTEAYIYFEQGYIHIPTRFHEHVKDLTIMHYDDLQETFIPFNYDVVGYKYEAAEVMRCLEAGKKESDLVPLQFSLDLMETLDKIRDLIGLQYPNHD